MEKMELVCIGGFFSGMLLLMVGLAEMVVIFQIGGIIAMVLWGMVLFDIE